MPLNKYVRIRKESFFIATAITLIMLAIVPGMFLIGVTYSGQYSVLLPYRSPVTFPSPGSLLAEAKLAKGNFLVASSHLRDPNFSETVVLLIDYGWYGATGLVINQPTKVKLSRVFPEIDGLRNRKDIVYIGGPVASNWMLLLIRSNNQPEESDLVFDDIYISSGLLVLQRMSTIRAQEKGFMSIQVTPVGHQLN